MPDSNPLWSRRAVTLWHDGHTVAAIAVLLRRPHDAVAAALVDRLPEPGSDLDRAAARTLPAWSSTTAAQGEPAELPDIAEAALVQGGRAADMVLRYVGGQTLQVIGNHWQVTRERVRQIVATESPWDITAIGAARRAFLASEKSIAEKAVLAWSHAHPGHPIAEAAAHLDLPVNEVRALLGRRCKLHEGISAHRGVKRRSDEDLLDDLRRFQANTGGKTALEYSAWAAAEGVPGHQTVMTRFGGWRAALNRAGLSDDAPLVRQRRHADEDLWAAVVDAVRAGNSTAADVDRWLAQTEGAPSFALIRARLERPWSALHAVTLQLLRGTYIHDPAWAAEVLRPRRWADLTEPDSEDPVDAVAAAIADLGPDITLDDYRAWASANGRPTAATLTKHAGSSWTQLVTQAGGRSTAKPHWACEEVIVGHLRAFLADHPNGTIEAYQQWRRSRSAPSVSTIASRFGGWRQARTHALGADHERPVHSR